MEADCDRVNPESDQFTITVLDNHGRTLRRERYGRLEIEQRAQALWQFDPNSIGVQLSNLSTPATTQPTSAPANFAGSPDAATVKAGAERDGRLKAVEAATRPATIDLSH